MNVADGDARTPAVSVVVATHRRPHVLNRLVTAIEGQRGAGDVELIVVDDASGDGTWSELQRLAATSRVPMRIVAREHNGGPAAARNSGWPLARAPIVAFTDDDCVPQAGWLAALVAGVGAGTDVVQGRTLPDPDQAASLGPFSRTLEVNAEDGFYQTCNIAYRRPVLERVGGFDERFRQSAEDTDLAWRARAAGATTAFAPDALVFHDVRPSSFRAHLAGTTRWDGVVLIVREHPGVRDHLHRRWFWKASHPKAMLAAAGLTATVLARRRTSRLAGAVAIVPYLRYRTAVAPLRGGPRRRVAVIPLALVADLFEVGVLATASVRYGCLLL